VAIPAGALVEASVHVGESVFAEGYTVHPFQEPTIDYRPDPYRFDIDRQAYRTADPYPEVHLNIGEPADWRHLRIITVEIAPMAYVANINRLEITPHMTVELTYENNGTTPQPIDREANISVRPHWDRMYRRNVINYEWLPVIAENRNNPGPVYLIITHPNFESAVQPLADWHHREGLETEVLAINTSSSTTVKNEITERYNQGDLEYVLLVGDTNYMPVYYWSGYLSDYWYTCITGGPDLFADITIGRLSVTNSTDVQKQVAKILTYEKNPPLDSWLNKIALVAHREDAPGKYVDCKEDIRTQIIPQPPYYVDTYYGHLPSGTNNNVATAINEGRNIVNYRGHGTTTSWVDWGYGGQSWTTTNINNLDNGDWTPVVFNIACDNNRIQSSCLGETWLNKSLGGAVASLGASAPSYTYPNHDYDKELFRQFCDSGPLQECRLGWISNAAATYIINNHGGIGQDNAKMYLWLGDPATEIWTDIPEFLTVDHPGEVNVGPQNIEITVTDNGNVIEGSTVFLYKPDEVYEVGTTGSDGVVTLRIMPSTMGTLYVTVSQHDYLPSETEITVNNYTPSLVLTLIPDAESFPRGSTMGYYVEGTNTEDVPVMLQYWADAYLPNGSPLAGNPVIGPVTFTLPAGQSVGEHLYHFIPSRAPLGTYTYIGNIGVHDDLIWADDSFVFTVTE
jgi:hypothetical protein